LNNKLASGRRPARDRTGGLLTSCSGLRVGAGPWAAALPTPRANTPARAAALHPPGIRCRLSTNREVAGRASRLPRGRLALIPTNAGERPVSLPLRAGSWFQCAARLWVSECFIKLLVICRFGFKGNVHHQQGRSQVVGFWGPPKNLWVKNIGCGSGQASPLRSGDRRRRELEARSPSPPLARPLPLGCWLPPGIRMSICLRPFSCAIACPAATCGDSRLFFTHRFFGGSGFWG